MARKLKTINRTGLVGEWLLNGNALDTSGNGNNGTATNVTYTSTDRGYQSQCGVFNGSSSFINTTTGADLGDNYSISAYFKHTGTTEDVIFSQAQGTGSTLIGIFLIVNADDIGGKIKFQEYNIGFANSLLEVTGTNCNDGKWHHIVSVNTGGTNYKIYLDNIKIGEATVTNRTTANNPFYIGRFSQATSGYFNGNIQSVRIFNRVISQQEIQTLYQEGLRQLGGEGYGTLFDGLVSFWRNDLDNNLYDLINSTTATRVGGTATNDLFGGSFAISNPNYTWASITYTAGYTFENDGTGWALKTNPSGLSSTGINRTTTLGQIFLFNRTPSASELTTIETLCKLRYLLPN